jgi:hypothetical protein
MCSLHLAIFGREFVRWDEYVGHIAGNYEEEVQEDGILAKSLEEFKNERSNHEFSKRKFPSTTAIKRSLKCEEINSFEQGVRRIPSEPLSSEPLSSEALSSDSEQILHLFIANCHECILIFHSLEHPTYLHISILEFHFS